MPLPARELERLKRRLEEQVKKGAPSASYARERLGVVVSPDELEQAGLDAEVYTQARAMTLTATQRRLSTEALRRMEAKPSTYGICLECQEEISAKRLEAVPEAQFCTRCQTLIERGARLETVATTSGDELGSADAD